MKVALLARLHYFTENVPFMMLPFLLFDKIIPQRFAMGMIAE